MKRFSVFSIICLLGVASLVRGQETASAALSPQEIEENYKSLKGHVQDMIDAQAALDKRLQSMAKEIADLRDQVSKPTGNYATQEELKRLADAVQEIDRKRVDDKETILKEIAKLGKTITAAPTHSSPIRPVITEA